MQTAVAFSIDHLCFQCPVLRDILLAARDCCLDGGLVLSLRNYSILGVYVCVCVCMFVYIIYACMSVCACVFA